MRINFDGLLRLNFAFAKEIKDKVDKQRAREIRSPSIAPMISSVNAAYGARIENVQQEGVGRGLLAGLMLKAQRQDSDAGDFRC